MVSWMRENSYSVVEVFKVIDNDFDSKINQRDLKHFLVEVLNIPENEIV